MLIDRSHLGWGLSTAVLFVVATVLYVIYASSWPDGASGRTWPGMWFGVAGTAAMVWAGFLAARKKTISARGGNLAWWLKSHLWIGTLSLPLICYHAAFRWGGLLEQMLWGAFLLVIVSGFLGVLLQNTLPRFMKVQLPSEVIPDQLAHVCHQMQTNADQHLLDACGADVTAEAMQLAPDQLPTPTEAPELWLSGYYVQKVRPYLGHHKVPDAPIASGQRAEIIFERARATLPGRLQSVVDFLESQCARRRELATQEKIHGWLHGWLRIHVPVSVALLVFAVVHIVSALYF